MERIKMVVVGGGSSYTPEIADGLIKRKDSLCVSELVLLDIESGRHKTDIIQAMLERMFKTAQLETVVTMTTDPEVAFKNCDYIICQIRVGGLEARAKDERIPLDFGLIGQETTGAGGMANGLRSVPAVLSLAKVAERVCPNAWFINFANPAGMVTEALLKHTSIKAIGLCNVPINMYTDVKESLPNRAYEPYITYAGLNHLTWITGVYQEGENVLPQLLKSREGKQLLANVEEIDGSEAFAENLGMIPSPYLNYYYFEKDMLETERLAAETEGTRAEVVMQLERDLFERYADAHQQEKPVQLEKRGGSLYSEAAVSLIESLVGRKPGIHVLNVKNQGAMTQLPSEWVVEVPCYVSRAGVVPLTGQVLPAHAEGLVRTVKAYEHATIEAALTGDHRALMEAMLCHPLIRDANDVEALAEALITAHQAYLPQFQKDQRTI